MLTPTHRARARAPGARRIASAARRLFAERGYAGTSMADVAAAAGVSKATVFHHYRSKRRLYESLIAEAVVGFREQMMPLIATESGLQDGLRSFTAAHVRRLAKLRGTMRLVMREMVDGSPDSRKVLSSGGVAQNFALVVQALRQAQARGQIRADADPGLAAFVLMSASWFLFQAGPVTRAIPDLAVTATPERYAAELARLLYRGLAPEREPAVEDET
jgi:TetR/AcrR family transcriptional regulator